MINCASCPSLPFQKLFPSANNEKTTPHVFRNGSCTLAHKRKLCRHPVIEIERGRGTSVHRMCHNADSDAYNPRDISWAPHLGTNHRTAQTCLKDADLGCCKHRPPVQVEPLCRPSAFSVALVSVRNRKCRVNVIAGNLIQLERTIKAVPLNVEAAGSIPSSHWP